MTWKTSEIDLHRSVADFLSWTVLLPAVWTTFPAGWTAMRPGAAGRLKGCGLKAGMPDILVFYNSFALGIELKVGNNKPSAIQLETFNDLRLAGIPVWIAKSIDDVEDILRQYSIPMRKLSYAPRLQASKSRRPQKPAQGETGAETQAEGT